MYEDEYPELAYDKDYVAINNEANIKACFHYYQSNPYGLMDIKEARFMVSLRQFFRRTGYLTIKQFACLTRGISRHQWIDIQATAFHEECGDR